MMASVNIKIQKVCAICKYWYNPANIGVIPTAFPERNIWRYDTSMRNICAKKGCSMWASHSCKNFENKFSEYMG